jgi:5-methylcytosine-specific restriction endonuclease McrA
MKKEKKKKKPKHWRKTSSYRQWRREVKMRDGRCMECGTTEELQAHHIIEARKSPELRFVSSNGLTLCGACHHEYHSSFDRQSLRN